MLSVTARRAVSVLWFFLKPNWEESRMLFSSMKEASWLFTAFLMTFAGYGSKEIGQNFLRLVGSAKGFSERELISARFQSSGKEAVSKERLMIRQSSGDYVGSSLVDVVRARVRGGPGVG